MNKLDEIYIDLLKQLLDSPSVKNNKINGTDATTGGVREITNCCITLDNIDDNILSIGRVSPTYLFGEWLWYFTGRNDVDFISTFGKIWKQMSDDNKTCNSAYGYIMIRQFGFNQIEKIIELLKTDCDSRRAVININTPRETVIETKDEPCTIALQFLIRDNKLNCTAMMRSNDAWFGFPYDIAFFTEVQKYIANKLHIDTGTYTHFAVSLHLYERNVDDAKKLINNPVNKPIKFNRNKFHIHKDYIADLMDVFIKYGDDSFVKNRLLELAEIYFEYEGENK